MTVEFFPSRANGTVSAPPSKSIAHRALIAAALSDGVSTVQNVAPSEDLLATIDCLSALGARIEYDSATAVVTGIFLNDIPDGAILPCRDSGSTLRFLIPLVLTTGKEFTFTGSKRLFSRPLGVYEDICREQGLRFKRCDCSLTVQGILSPGIYSVPGDISSQFVTGLCLALPLLDGNSSLTVHPPVQSQSYIDMTWQILNEYGIISARKNHEFCIPGRQCYSALDYLVEGDWSNAAFLDALNLLGGNVKVTGLFDGSCQGDRIYPRLFDALRSGTPTLDLSDCPDLGPVCFALAAVLHGAAFTGVRRLRLKESDRIASMTEELRKFGAEIAVSDDCVSISPSALHEPGVPLSGHNDHRVVMALAVLASRTGGVITGAEAVSKSFPNFFDRLESLGIRMIRIS